MSAEFPTLAKVVTATLTECGIDDADMVETPDIVRAWREACTIRTAEQLEALPAAAVLIVRGNQPYFRHAVTASSLPALLIWHPDWSQP